MKEPTCETDQHGAKRLPSPYGPRAFEGAAAMFRGAGDVARLRTLVGLLEGERHVTELAEMLSEAPVAVSARLRLLLGDGLVRNRRDGRKIYYRIADDHVSRMIRNVLAHASEAPAPADADD